MRLLLDTHILLWALCEPGRLSASTRHTIEDPSSEVLFSAASIWEIAIKFGLRRADFPIGPERIARSAYEAGFTELLVSSHIAARVASLPPHHRDPFDRLLVAQAMAEQVPLCSVDAALAPYSHLVTLAG